MQPLRSGGYGTELARFAGPLLLPLELQGHGEVAKAPWVCRVLGAWPLKKWPTKDPENCSGALGLSSLPSGFHQEEDFLEFVVYPRNLIMFRTHRGKYRSATEFYVWPAVDLKTYHFIIC